MISFSKRKKISSLECQEFLFLEHMRVPFQRPPWLAPQRQRAELGLVTALCVPAGDAESIQSTWVHPEDIPCLFLALWHYLFGLGKLQRNACFLLKHHRLSSPGQVFSPVRWLFLSGFILASFREEKKISYLRFSFAYLVF